jgi:hypothetical protein
MVHCETFVDDLAVFIVHLNRYILYDRNIACWTRADSEDMCAIFFKTSCIDFDQGGFKDARRSDWRYLITVILIEYNFLSHVEWISGACRHNIQQICRDWRENGSIRIHARFLMMGAAAVRCRSSFAVYGGSGGPCIVCLMCVVVVHIVVSSLWLESKRANEWVFRVQIRNVPKVWEGYFTRVMNKLQGYWRYT